MAKKPKRVSSKSSGPKKFKLTAGAQRKQDNAAMRENGTKLNKKKSPAAQARELLATPTVGGTGNWRTQPRNPKTGRFIKR